MRFRIAIVILLAVGLYACATTDGEKTEKVRYSRDHINAAEINTSNANNAYELVKALDRQVQVLLESIRRCFDIAALGQVVAEGVKII